MLMKIKYKCFWCDKEFVDLIKHTEKCHKGLHPRSYSQIIERLKDIESLKCPKEMTTDADKFLKVDCICIEKRVAKNQLKWVLGEQE